MTAVRLALLLALISAPAGAESVLRTDPSHMPGSGAPADPSSTLPVMRYAIPPQVVIRSPASDWRSGGKISRNLSDACARQRFNETVPMRFRAFFKDAVLGVAFGHGLNLTDRDQQADPKLIYLFRQAGTTACLVLELPNTDPRVLQRVTQEPGH